MGRPLRTSFDRSVQVKGDAGRQSLMLANYYVQDKSDAGSPDSLMTKASFFSIKIKRSECKYTSEF